MLLFVVGLLTFVICFWSLRSRSAVIFEVTTHGYGMVYPTSEVLDLRLYQNGRIEYDVYPPQGREFLNIHYWFPRHHSEVNSTDFNELNRLIEQPDLLTAQERYKGSRPHIDDTWETTIRFHHGDATKQIVAINFWDDPNDATKYPPSMIALLKRVSALRKNLTGRN